MEPLAKTSRRGSAGRTPIPNVPQTLRTDHTDAVQNDVGPAIGAAALRTMHEGNGVYAHNAFVARNNPVRPHMNTVGANYGQQDDVLKNYKKFLVHYGSKRTTLSGLIPVSQLAQALQVAPVIQNLRRPDL